MLAKKKQVIFFFITFILLSYSLGEGWYYHNDGVTLYCSMFSWLDLLHPGKPSVLACTYDHQPLYHYIVKILGLFSIDQLLIFQLLNVFFISLACSALFNLFNKSLATLPSIATSTFYFTSYSVLYSVQELRMYSLFLLTATLLLTHSVLEKNKKTLIHWVGFYNFYLYIIPFFSYLLVSFKEIREGTRGVKLSLSLLVTMVMIKTPFVLFWRAKERAGDTGYSFEMFKSLFLDRVFDGFIGSSLISWLLFILSCVFFFKQKNHYKIKLYVAIQLICILVTILFFTLALKATEIEWRYFHFFYPLASLLLFHLFAQIKLPLLANTLSLALISLSILNCASMKTRGSEVSQAHKNSVQTMNLLFQNKFQITVENLYFYESYLGIFTENFKVLESPLSSLESGKPENTDILLTTTLSHKEHLESCQKLFQQCLIVYDALNILNLPTLMSADASNLRAVQFFKTMNEEGI